MLFTEMRFWIFFLITFTLYLALPHRWQNRMLLAASYVFYGAWDWRFLSLILISTTTDFIVGSKLDSETCEARRRRLLSVSLCVNLGMLATFKYLGFFADSFLLLMSRFGLPASEVTLAIVLPVGISFFVFQSLSYTIDIYRRELEPARRFDDFALFVAFFPQLVAGPIERARNLLPNITGPRTVTWEGVGRGAVLCLVGLIKKIVVADSVASSVDAVYAMPAPSGLDVALGTWLFAIQIYCDFSGYTDIARGVAKMLGFRLMLNFAQPYFARNPQAFWRRWHISLSTWLRDYLYVSLGGNRGGRWRTYRNLMATMILGGLWHGAAWNFVLWGVYQGVLLCAHRALFGRASPAAGVAVSATERTAGAAGRPPLSGGALRLLGRVLSIFLFFQVVCYGWLLFRAGSFDQIAQMTGALLGVPDAPWALVSMPMPPAPALLGILFVFCWDVATEFARDVRFYLRAPLAARAALYAAMVYLLAFGGATPTGTFIYFQF